MSHLSPRQAVGALGAGLAALLLASTPSLAAPPQSTTQQSCCTMQSCDQCHIDTQHSNIPDGWKVQVDRHPLVPKQHLYIFTASVLDQAGKPVRNATLSLKLHKYGAPGFSTVPMQAAGDGNYWTRATDTAADASHLEVIVEPATTR